MGLASDMGYYCCSPTYRQTNAVSDIRFPGWSIRLLLCISNEDVLLVLEQDAINAAATGLGGVVHGSSRKRKQCAFIQPSIGHKFNYCGACLSLSLSHSPHRP